MGQDSSKPRSCPIDVLNYAPALPVYPHPLGETAAGRTLPSEITNKIFALVLTYDNNITVLPRSLPLIGTHLASATSQPEHTYLTSRCALHRTCRASRQLYYPMFLNKVRTFELQSLRELVEDFNFGPFVHGLVRPLSSSNETRLRQMPFSVKLMWTDAAVQDPTTGNLEMWLDFTKDDEGASPLFIIRYEFDCMPAKYVHQLQLLLNGRIFSRNFEQGPELKAIVTAFMDKLQSRTIYQEGPRVKLGGQWVDGKWVVKVDGGKSDGAEDDESMDFDLLGGAMATDGDVDTLDGLNPEIEDGEEPMSDCEGIGTRVKRR